MSVAEYSRFVAECIVTDPDKQPGLPEDEVYGVYLSWCFLNRTTPGSNKALWAALQHHGHRRDGGSSNRFPGLAITGPAAVDYILSSQPSLV